MIWSSWCVIGEVDVDFFFIDFFLSFELFLLCLWFDIFLLVLLECGIFVWRFVVLVIIILMVWRGGGGIFGFIWIVVVFVGVW